MATFSSYAEADFELHEMIWNVAGNRQMAMMLDRIAGPMIALQAQVYQPRLDELLRKEKEAREALTFALSRLSAAVRPPKRAWRCRNTSWHSGSFG